MNRRRELTAFDIRDATWPASRVAEAVQAVARHVGLPITPFEAVATPEALSVNKLNTWIETAADRVGVQAEQAFVGLDELDVLLSNGGPALIRLAALENTPFIAVLGRRRRFVLTLGRDLRVHRLDRRTV